MPISDQYPYEKKYKAIHGKKMAYMEHGEGDPIVFLHGNPTSSYLWRNIMPYMEGKGRLIAPDLIGMGDSEKLENSMYTFAEQRDFLYTLLEELGVKENVTLVIQDWGSILGFHWAHQNPDAMKGIAFMEGIVAPVPTWDAWPDEFREIIQGFRSEAGEEMILKNNMFVEQLLPGATLRPLTDVEMAEYRRPFLNEGEDRRPTLTFPRSLPIAGEPPEVVQIASEYSEWLAQTEVPKLFFNPEPGILIVGEVREMVRKWPNLTEVQATGLHFIQEDCPDLIGESISEWYATLS